MIKDLKYFIHYFFGKHEWVFKVKVSEGNKEKGWKEKAYIFECRKCHKQKYIDVAE